jgi:hypothetical protein
MPKPAPQHIAAQMPNGWKLWWIDGQIIHSQPLQHDKQIPGYLWPGRSFQIGEVSPSSGLTYDAMISFWMADYDFADGDRVSLIGHIPADAKKIEAPSFLIDHDSGAYCPVGLGLPESWVVCGGNSAVGGRGMMFKAVKNALADPKNGNIGEHIWRHIQKDCAQKQGYIYPLYKDFMDWIVHNAEKGPNQRWQQQSKDEINF